MVEYTIKVQHDEDGIEVEIFDLDPDAMHKDKEAIIAALEKAIERVRNSTYAVRFQ